VNYEELILNVSIVDVMEDTDTNAAATYSEGDGFFEEGTFL